MGATKTDTRPAALRARAAVELRVAAPGDPWYTWRGSLRAYQPGPGRRVWNAYSNGALVGSACATVHEGGAAHQDSSTRRYADNGSAYTGPLFVDPDCFDNRPFFLSMESIYVRKRARRKGVAAELVKAVRAVGLPVFAEFADEHLERHCVELSEGAELDLDVEAERQWDTPALCLFERCENADSDPEAFDGWPQGFASGDSLRLAFTVVQPIRCETPRNPDDCDPRADDLWIRPEGTAESDVAIVRGRLVGAGGTGVGWLRAELAYQLRLAGIDGELDYGRVRRDRSRENERLRVYLNGRIENAPLLAARAAFRHFLADFDSDWEPSTLSEAVSACMRSHTGEFQIDRIQVERTNAIAV